MAVQHIVIHIMLQRMMSLKCCQCLVFQEQQIFKRAVDGRLVASRAAVKHTRRPFAQQEAYACRPGWRRVGWSWQSLHM